MSAPDAVVVGPRASGSSMSFLPRHVLMALNAGGLSLCLAAGVLFSATPLGAEIKPIRIVVGASAAVVLVAAAFLARRERLRPWDLAVSILLASFLLRLYYVLCTPYDISTHDLGTFLGYEDPAYSSGHLAYIKYLYVRHALPDFDPRPLNAFYNPPLFHIVGAAWLTLMDQFTSNARLKLESLQFLTLGFATVAINAGCVMLAELGARDRPFVFGCLAIAFLPIFIMLGAALNNDMMALMLYLLAALYTIRWQRVPSYSNLLAISVLFGFGMLTKPSTALIAPAIAWIFLWTAWHDRGSMGRYLSQFALFLTVAAPLSLAWAVRNHLLYGIPPAYVPAQDASQYVGDHSVFARLLPFQPIGLQDVFVRLVPASEFNIWGQLFKTALFGEHTYVWAGRGFNVICYLLLMLSIATAVSTKGMMLAACLTGRFRIAFPERIFVLTADGALLAAFLKFCFDYPYVCTMDFRYVVPTAIFSIIGMTVSASGPLEGSGRDRARYVVAGTHALLVITALLAAFLYVKFAGFQWSQSMRNGF